MYFIPKYILVLFLLILIDYSAAIIIERLSKEFHRKLLLIISLMANVGILAYFKYFNLIAETLQTALGWVHVDKQLTTIDLVLPIGLSFHTFQSMAYTMEVYKGKQKAEKHLGIYAVYVLFFPQMVAGPIERFQTLGNQLKTNHVFSWVNMVNGLRLILFGLVVKMAVADNMAIWVNNFYETPTLFNGYATAFAMVLFSIQIYTDFWGYSTIAAGSSLLMGIHLMDNFKAPYLSTGISQFWNRWHISLSTWFRDYVYIPLGGSRSSTMRWMFAIIVVFALSGLWHGANWTFVVWGLLHASFYFIEKLFKKMPIQIFPWLSNFFGGVFTFSAVTIAWVFFRSSDFDAAFGVLNQLGVNNGRPLLPDWQCMVALLFVLSAEVFLRGNRFDKQLQQQHLAIRWIVYFLLLLALIVLAPGDIQPFIYFQF
jgi:alginate O-acetyltransferase complex protein AlgI